MRDVDALLRENAAQKAEIAARVRSWRLVLRQGPKVDAGLLVARAALAAHALGGFEPFRNSLLTATSSTERANLLAVASRVGLDGTDYRTALDDRQRAVELDADAEAASRLGVAMAPALLIGTRKIVDPEDERPIATILEWEAARFEREPFASVLAETGLSR